MHLGGTIDCRCVGLDFDMFGCSWVEFDSNLEVKFRAFDFWT